MEQRKVEVFLLHGPRHGEKVILDRAYPVFKIPQLQKVRYIENPDELPIPAFTEHLTYERLMRSQNSGVWIYEFKEAA